ncbi:hypothetical protein Tco_1101337 [Tanacetum coccineum]
MAAQVTTHFDAYMHKETSYDFAYESVVTGEKVDLDQRMVAAVCQEMMKRFKGKGVDQGNVATTSKGNDVPELKVNKMVPTFLNVSSFVNKVVHPKDVTMEFFHGRLRHTPASKVIPVDNCKHENISHFPLNTCMLAKQHRLSFPKSNTRSLIPFELLHVDLWGPYKPMLS